MQQQLIGVYKFLQCHLSEKFGQILDMTSHATTGAGAKLAPAQVQSSAKVVPHLFSGFSPSDIAGIMAAGVVRRIAAGQIIVQANDPGTHLFLIQTGVVDYYRLSSEGQQVLITQLLPGDHFGLVTMLKKPVGYMGTAETTGETLLYVWEHTWIRNFVAKHSLLMENAFRIALEYVRLYSERHLALVSDDAQDRLRQAISQLEVRAGHPHARGLEVEITNERLASLADIGYYTTSRLLNKWKRIGAIEKGRGKVVVLSPEKMLS